MVMMKGNQSLGVILFTFFIGFGNCYAQQTSPALTLSAADSISFSRDFFNGLKAKTLGDMNVALRFFDRCVQLNPASDAAWYERAIAYHRQGKSEKALQSINKALAINGSTLWYLGLKADLLYKTKRYVQLLNIYDDIISIEPNNADHYFNKARALVKLSRIDDAFDVYDKIEEITGPDVELAMHRQKAYLKKGQLNKAVDELNNLIRQHPGEARFYLMRGELYDSDNRSRKALDSYKKALKLEPSNGIARLAIAGHYRGKGMEEKSMEELKKAFISPDLRLDSKIKIIINNFLSDGSSTQLLDQALELSDLLLQHYPHEAKVHAIYGDVLLRQNKYIQARDAYSEAIKLEKNVFLLWDQYLRLQIELSDYEGLAEASAEALTHFPEDVSFYLFNGVANLQTHSYRKAIESLEKGLEKVTNKEEKGQLYASLGDAYHAAGMHIKSDECYENVLKIQPNNALVLNNYAFYLAQRGKKLSLAESMAEKALELNPENVSFLDTYAWILFKLSRLEKAHELISKVVDKQPDNPTFLQHYGDILFKMGKKDIAVEMWDKAKRLGGNSGLLDKKIEENNIYD